jgi:hypothetical protein
MSPRSEQEPEPIHSEEEEEEDIESEDEDEPLPYYPCGLCQTVGCNRSLLWHGTNNGVIQMACYVHRTPNMVLTRLYDQSRGIFEAFCERDYDYFGSNFFEFLNAETPCKTCQHFCDGRDIGYKVYAKTPDGLITVMFEDVIERNCTN